MLAEGWADNGGSQCAQTVIREGVAEQAGIKRKMASR
jgi:hypothetical protein